VYCGWNSTFFQTRQGLEFLRKRREPKVEDFKKILYNCRALTNQLLAISRLKQKLSNRVRLKVRKAQHQNFGVSSYLSFFLSASSAATYIFTHHNFTTTIISLEPCA
jgi:hypothetical protein